jgi:hypothetical protein
MVSAIVVTLAVTALAQQKPPDELLEPFHGLYDPFYEGCCVIPRIPRPGNLSHATVSESRLRKALNCATNNDFVGGTAALAKGLGDRTALHVAYHYGNYMAEEPWLTIAGYSVGGKHGVLFDVAWDGSEYGVPNLPPLLFKHKQWQVGETFGGLSSYTRLWHLAQDIASRPKVTIPVALIRRTKPASCFVFGVDQTGWQPGG